jgi:hypothetical protein
MCDTHTLKMGCSSKVRETDTINTCHTFECNNSTRRVLWSAIGVANPCGYFIVSVKRACGPVDIFVNNGVTPVKTLAPGTSVIVSSAPLTSIEAVCSGTGGSCKIDLCVTVHYECC